MDNQNISFDSRDAQLRRRAKTTKNGLYIFAVSAVVLAVIVVVNLIVGLIPSHITAFDTSTQKFYTIDPQTKQYLSSLDKNITIMWVCSDSMDDPTMTHFLEEYAAMSSKISLKRLDPVADSAKLKPYVQDLEVELTEDTCFLLVESEYRHQILLLTDLYFIQNDLIDQYYGLGALPYTYVLSSEEYYQLYTYAESAGYASQYSFYAENVLTSAIEYTVIETITEDYTSNRTFVEEPSLSEPILSTLTLTHALIWAAIFVIIIPLTILIIGLVTWIKRKRR